MKKTFYKLILMAAVAATCALGMHAETLQCDGFSYELDSAGNASIVLGDTYYTGAIVVPETLNGAKVTNIGRCAFNGCHGLSSISLPATIKTIDDYAFNACDSLKTITMGDSVTRIGDFAFHGCARLSAITLPASLTEIGYEAFFDCELVKAITLGKNVSKIGDRAFQRCLQLKSITVDAENPVFCDVDGILLNKAATILRSSARKNTNWKNYVAPATVTEISPYAFYGCNSMQTCALPDGLTTIGEWAFSNCEVMKTFTLPASVTKLGANAFFMCTDLAEFHVLNSTPLAVRNLENPFGMFTDLSTRTLIVPKAEDVAAYQAAEVWKDFGTITYEGSGLDKVVESPIHVTTNGLEIAIAGTDTGSINTLYDINGATIYRGTANHISAPGAGFYILTVGSKTYKLAVEE